MKKGIHPEYVECKVHCGCGAGWMTRSTVPSMKIEVCSSCHPFYRDDGEHKFLDALGRVDRFTKKFGGDYFKKPPAKKKTKLSRG